jgi:dolichol-phosphate mannosyltransferase
MNKVLLFIPCYNCELQIVRVLKKIDIKVQTRFSEIIVVDNRSLDSTVSKAIELASSFKVPYKVFKNKENYNLGGSIKVAINYALNNGYTHIAVLHGDDQGNINDLLPIVDDLDAASSLNIGARFHTKSILRGYSFVRTLGNRILNLVCGIINHRKIDDLIAGINLFESKIFADKVYKNFPNNLTFDAHLLQYAIYKGYSINYFPITWSEEDQISNAKVLRQATIILRFFVEYFILRGKVFAKNKSGRDNDFAYPSEVVYSSDN